MKTKHQLLQEWNESTYGLEFGDYVYQYFVSEFNKPPVYGGLERAFLAGRSKQSWESFLQERALPPSPGSVDVEEKKQHECEFYLITDIAVHSCECGNITVSDGHTSTEYAPLKVDGLGDSSGSEKEFTSQEVFEWFQTKRFQREQGTQEYTMIYEIDLPKIINQFIKDKLA